MPLFRFLPVLCFCYLTVFAGEQPIARLIVDASGKITIESPATTARPETQATNNGSARALPLEGQRTWVTAPLVPAGEASRWNPMPAEVDRGLPLPDLATKFFYGSCLGDGTITTELRFINLGPGDAPPFRVAFYLGETPTSYRETLYAFSDFTEGLAAGETAMVTGSAPAPDGLKGDFYVFVSLDDLGEVTESSEANYGLSEDFVTLPCAGGQPDLAVTRTEVICSSTQRLTLDVEISNIGVAGVGPSQLQIFLKDENDRLQPLHDLEVLGFNPDTRWSFQYSWSATQMLQGVYRLYAMIDSNEVVDESNEMNNVGESWGLGLPCTNSLPDLLVDEVVATRLRGNWVDLQATLRNQSVVSAGPFLAGLYASDDADITPDDLLLMEMELPVGLPAGGLEDVTAEEIFLETGTYFIGAVADVDDQVVEAEETNNTGGLSGSRDFAPPLGQTAEFWDDVAIWEGGTLLELLLQLAE
ncbi:MAG: CARDB domain-containing protein [Acidobacteriota bacterium]|nr:CARDB domain-containing protein [Acidobacteriota bacterium]